MQYTIHKTLAADVASSATFTAAYPDGTNAGTFTAGVGHNMVMGGIAFQAPIGFTLTFGASNITVTNNSGATWPEGAEYYLVLETPGARDVRDSNGKNPVARAALAQTVLVNLGAPDTADADGICEEQAVDVSEAQAVLDGAIVGDDGVAVLDVPRNVVAAWTGTSVCTVTGEDEYGQTVVESSASGTSMTGKKAFKRVTDVSFSADVTAATVGFGDVLGLPVFLPGAGHVLKELQDGATATAGTVVAGAGAKPTATTGDVRGTYDPNAAADGSKSFQLVVALADPAYRGATQFAG